MVVVVCWLLFVARCALSVDGCVLFVVYCLRFAARWLFVARCVMCIVRCVLVAVKWYLFVDCNVVCVVVVCCRCVLFVAFCWLFDV